MSRISLFLFAATLLLASCDKDDPSQYNPNVKAAVSVEFDNIAGSSDLQLNTGSYTNAAGEAFTVTKLKYYVSNFVFTKTDGTVYTVPQTESYFLVDESDAASHEPIVNIPEGEYKTLSFMVGVDSLRNTKDISERTGDLDPTTTGADMYWSWNSGYIFFKLEGSSPASPMGFMYHIGGFGGYSTATLNNTRTVTIDLTQRGVPQVKDGKETNIHLMADILKVFNGSNNISIAGNSMIMMPTPLSASIANNYTAMFRHDHTEN